MNIFKSYKRNADLIVAGAKFVAGETDDGKEISIRVARAHESYEPFQNEVQALLEKNKRKLDSLAKSDKKAENKLRGDLVMSAFASTCIKSWENVRDEQDNEMVCNEESIQKIANELPELLEDLFKFSTTDSNYVGEFDEGEALKN